MKKKKNQPEYTDYNKLVYFRWKALIRSEEYNEFYETAEDLHSEMSDLEYEINDEENELITVYFNDNVELHGLSYRDLLKYIKKHRKSTGIGVDIINKFEELIGQLETLEERVEEIISEAEKRFGLIMESPDLGILKPIDRPIEDLPITFKDYLPKTDKNRIKKEYESSTVKKVQYNKGYLSFFNKFDVIENIFVSQDLDRGYELFCIDTKMPTGFILEALKKLLGSNNKKRSDRKEFDSWEEAFKVWDIQQKENKDYVGKKLELRTTYLMSTTTSFPYWKTQSAESSRLRVRDKLKVAEDLIALAGKGQFRSL